MTTERTIPKPDPEREPLKVNVYRFVQNCTTALAPLFPYVDEGSIVPCAATFRGAPGRRYGRFQHFNTVDEVAVMWGGSGAQSRAAGLIHVGPKLHLVAPMEHAENPDDTNVIVITQRQSIGKVQREEVRFICDKCDRRLFVEELDATPAKRGTKPSLGTAPFITIAETYKATQRFNADEAARKCAHCGHQNPPFPIEEWGWGLYVNQSEIAQRGARSIGTARDAPPPPQGAKGGR